MNSENLKCAICNRKFIPQCSVIFHEASMKPCHTHCFYFAIFKIQEGSIVLENKEMATPEAYFFAHKTEINELSFLTFFNYKTGEKEQIYQEK